MRGALTVAAMTILAGCAAETSEVLQAPTPASAATAQTEPHPVPSDHAKLLVLVSDANAARVSGDATALYAAARTLDTLGAVPHETTRDFALNWTREALTMDPSVEQPPLRGRVRGPSYREERLAPGATLDLSTVFYAAEAAKITLDPSGAGPLAWSVGLAEGDAPVCAGRISGAAEACVFVPVFTESYRIRIENTSDAPVTTLLITN